MENFLKFLILPVVLSALFLAFLSGTARKERYECHDWNVSSVNNPAFYVTDWQIEQCIHYGIRLNGTTLPR